MYTPLLYLGVATFIGIDNVLYNYSTDYYPFISILYSLLYCVRIFDTNKVLNLSLRLKVITLSLMGYYGSILTYNLIRNQDFITYVSSLVFIDLVLLMLYVHTLLSNIGPNMELFKLFLTSTDTNPNALTMANLFDFMNQVPKSYEPPKDNISDGNPIVDILGNLMQNIMSQSKNHTRNESIRRTTTHNRVLGENEAPKSNESSDSSSEEPDESAIEKLMDLTQTKITDLINEGEEKLNEMQKNEEAKIEAL